MWTVLHCFKEIVFYGFRERIVFFFEALGAVVLIFGLKIDGFSEGDQIGWATSHRILGL